mmetsp:Transcript_29566/g.51917  ORF Transcript_29566/g.51917 Transcript_29566/m.51917 type:complete len:241 (-) Transcript_29566:170-892(-)|eukprot:CAMPEP_0197525772 /NCGR_PEP_ID=MMETSP1318-20131121/14335_1 /TAXON_ID=552666 /ORGANISM="Partenskyella glossopodia, Strain RCC365" /LENGTH=240 /DNA_ID=CAMNT_0043079505 /DNA_START=86 /DNA_END=805 /DNA_ORIENTATION=-
MQPPQIQRPMFAWGNPPGSIPSSVPGSVPGSYDFYARQGRMPAYGQPLPPMAWNPPPLPPRPPHPVAQPGLYHQGATLGGPGGYNASLLQAPSGVGSSGSGLGEKGGQDEKEGSFVCMIQRPVYRAILLSKTARPAIVIKSNATHMNRKQPKRRPSCDLREEERWYCPYGCGKFYRKSSTISIKTHTKKCPYKPDKAADKALSAAPSTNQINIPGLPADASSIPTQPLPAMSESNAPKAW